MDIEERLREVELEVGSRRAEHQISPTLDRVAALVTLLGDPHRAYPVVHVTGTNGKTSTTRMIETLLRERGLRTGRFTSPHLVSMRERIAVDGVPLERRALHRALRRDQARTCSWSTTSSRPRCPSSRSSPA